MGLYYEKQLEDKIRRQKEEITRLLAENQKLKGMNNTIYEETVEQARAEGQEEAWKLARKCMLMTDQKREAIFGSGHNALYGVLTYFDYEQAAAKVKAWEKAKEEICVGDVLLSNETGNKCIVTRISNEVVTTLWNDGSCGDRPKDFVRGRFKKIGHIDVDTWLAQIGGESK